MKTPSEIQRENFGLRRGEFNRFCRHLLEAGDQGLTQALALAEASKAPERVITSLKTAVATGTTTADGWAEQIAYRPLSEAVLQSQASISFFDALLPSMLAAPPRVNVALVVGSAVGSIVGEGAARPLVALSYDTEMLEEYEVSAIVALSNDLVRLGGQRLERTLDVEFRLALARAMNEYFITLLNLDTSPGPSIAAAGTTAAGVRTDIRNLLNFIDTDARSAIILGMSPKRAKQASQMSTTTGARAFPELGLQGGAINNVPVVVSDRVSDAEVIAVDGSKFAGFGGTVIPDATDTADIELASPATEPAAAGVVLTSLWQRNMRAIRLKRRFGVKQLRENAAGKLTGVAWGNA